MTRILALLAGVVLIGVPAWWLREVTVPLPPYRRGGYADFVFYGQALLAIYGSVLLGAAVYLVRARRNARPLFPIELFKAGLFGVLGCGIVFFAGGIIYGLVRYGAFAVAVGGNLWGLLAIFWAILGALVSAGLALLLYAWRGPPVRAGSGPQKG